jgi:hypothetical protein
VSNVFPLKGGDLTPQIVIDHLVDDVKAFKFKRIYVLAEMDDETEGAVDGDVKRLVYLCGDMGGMAMAGLILQDCALRMARGEQDINV